VLLVVGGALFGMGIIRAQILPIWTGFTLIISVVLALVINLMELPDIFQVASSAIRNIAFIGMGFAVLKGISVPDSTKTF
jgi:hypothetical protein